MLTWLINHNFGALLMLAGLTVFSALISALLEKIKKFF